MSILFRFTLRISHHSDFAGEFNNLLLNVRHSKHPSVELFHVLHNKVNTLAVYLRTHVAGSLTSCVVGQIITQKFNEGRIDLSCYTQNDPSPSSSGLVFPSIRSGLDFRFSDRAQPCFATSAAGFIHICFTSVAACSHLVAWVLHTMAHVSRVPRALEARDGQRL